MSNDEAVLKMLAGANFGPDASLTLPSGETLGSAEAQAMTSMYAPPAQEPETIVYAVGLCYASVCTNDTIEGATATLNRLQPTGVTPWSLSETNFVGGESNIVPCNKTPDTHRHVLFSC